VPSHTIHLTSHPQVKRIRIKIEKNHVKYFINIDTSTHAKEESKRCSDDCKMVAAADDGDIVAAASAGQILAILSQWWRRRPALRR
jgi:hypothetical protein